MRFCPKTALEATNIIMRRQSRAQQRHNIRSPRRATPPWPKSLALWAISPRNQLLYTLPSLVPP